jgi:hypothetical protein
MHDNWEECLKNWEKINQKMRDIQLLEFSMPGEFVDINDIVKQIAEHDHKFEADFLKITTLGTRQGRNFVDRPIGASIVLRYLRSNMADLNNG